MISGRRAFFSTIMTSVLSFFSAFVGFVLHALLSKKFSTKASMDAFIVAGTLPIFIPMIFMMAFWSSFIPLFHEYEREVNDDEKTWKMSQSFFLIFTVFLLVATAVGYPMIPFLVKILAPGFNGETYVIAVNLSRIMFPMMFFSGMISMLNAFEHAAFKFFRPAIAPIPNTVLNIAIVFYYEPTLGIYSAAIGALVGGFSQFLFMIPIIFRKARFSFKLDFKHPKFKKCLLLMTPLLLAQFLGKSDQLIDRFIASQLPSGSISYLGYAFRILNNFSNLIGTSIVVVSLPMLSGSIGDKQRMGKIISSAIELWLIFVTPLIVCLMLMRIPIVQVLYQRGEFSAVSTAYTASALLCYAGGFLTTLNVVSAALYASQKTKFILILCLIMALFNIISAVILTKYLGFRGPALAFSLKIILSNIIGYTYTHAYLKIRIEKSVLKTIVNITIANVCAFLVVQNYIPAIYGFCKSISSDTFLLPAHITAGYAFFILIYLFVILLIDRKSLMKIYTLIRP